MTSLRDTFIGIVLIVSFVQIECTLSGELNNYFTHVINILTQTKTIFSRMSKLRGGDSRCQI